MAPMKTVPVFGGNAVNLRRNEAVKMPSSGRKVAAKPSEGDRGT